MSATGGPTASNNGWPELVTTALLGTARRLVPHQRSPAWGIPPAREDPALELLDLAAARDAAGRAGRPVERAGGRADLGATGSDRALPVGPPRARRLLEELLARPQPSTINLWLAACVARGYGLAAEHWTPLAVLAARSTAYERPLLGRALGPPGLWFLQQNAAWRRLAEGAAADPAPNPAPDSQAAGGAVGQPVVVPETVHRRPDSLFQASQPWPDGVCAAALAVIGSGILRAAGRAYASRLGAEMPLEAYPLVIRAAEEALSAGPAPLAERRLARDCFVACEEAVWTRIEIREAFDPSDPTAERLAIPPLGL
jgi:hypothetical protein